MNPTAKFVLLFFTAYACAGLVITFLLQVLDHVKEMRRHGVSAEHYDTEQWFWMTAIWPVFLAVGLVSEVKERCGSPLKTLNRLSIRAAARITTTERVAKKLTGEHQ